MLRKQAYVSIKKHAKVFKTEKEKFRKVDCAT